MKTPTLFTPVLLALIMIVLVFPGAANAQDGNASDARYSTQGFHIKPHALGVAWTVEDDFVEIDGEEGRGLGLGLGYGFSERFAVFAEWSGATVYDNEGDGDYGLYHVDLGGRVTFGNPGKKVKLLLEAAGTRRVAEILTVGGDTITATGMAGTAGGGIQYFVSRQVALEGVLLASVGEMSDIEVNGTSIPTDALDLQTVSARFHIGISWWP